MWGAAAKDNVRFGVVGLQPYTVMKLLQGGHNDSQSGKMSFKEEHNIIYKHEIG